MTDTPKKSFKKRPTVILSELKKKYSIIMVFNRNVSTDSGGKYAYVTNVDGLNIDYSSNLMKAKSFPVEEAKKICKKLSKELIHSYRLPTSLH